MIKEKYLIVGHICWCSPVVGKSTREAEVMVSNPSNAGKNRATCDASAVEKRNFNFFIFIHIANIYFTMQKNDIRHLCVDIGDGLRIPLVMARTDARHLLRT